MSDVHAEQPALGFHVHRGDGQHLAAAQQAGASFVVLVFSWRDIEPVPNYLYWDRVDAAVAAAEYYGLGVVARLDRPPAWARSDSGPTPWRLDAYAAFVQRVAARYGNRLDGIVLWNEPNLSLEWDGQTPDPAAYAALLRVAYPAAKEAAPDVPVFMAGLAFTLGDGVEAIDDLSYLRGVYAAGGGRYFDGLAIHAYGFGAPPDAEADPDRLNFGRMLLQRAVMAEMGDATKPIWVTEMGWRVAAPDPADAWQVVTPAQQAAYVQLARDVAADQYPWIERMALWELNADGDLYGYGLWSGEHEPSLTYEQLAAEARRTCGRDNCAPPGLSGGSGIVTILAADTLVRLGDIGTLHPHWGHLYNGGDAFSPVWRSEFFLSQQQAQTLDTLALETMQVDQPTPSVRINGHFVGHLRPRMRPDPTSTWATQRIDVPDGIIQAGRNIIEVHSGMRNPARQYAWWRWENFQVRHVRLLSSPVTSNGPAESWREVPSPPGWAEINRIRAGSARVDGTSIYVTTNRSGGIWRGELAPDDPSLHLVSLAQSKTDTVFTDVVETDGGLLAATERGLMQTTDNPAAWSPVTGAPLQLAYVVVRTEGGYWAGFEGDGVWRAATAAGPWERAGLAGKAVLDLAADGDGRLIAAANDGVWLREATTWSRLAALPTVAEDAEVHGELAGHFVSHLFVGAQDGIVVRSQDRMWRWDGAGWEPYGPEQHQGRLYTIAACCEDGARVGTNQAGLWARRSGAWESIAPGRFEDLEVTSSLQVGRQTLLGTTNGLFVLAPDGAVAAATGLPPVVTGIEVDANGVVLAATPVGIYAAQPNLDSWGAVSPPWIVWDLASNSAGRLFAARSDGLAYSDTPAAGGWKTSSGMESVTFFRARPDPENPQRVWAGSWGNNVGVSRDGGRSLMPLHNGLETLSVLDIWWHPTPGQVTIGTIEGLYRSDDGGASWFKLPGDLGQQTVYAVYQTDNGALWAGAADGLWVSRDYGATWQIVPALPPTTVLSLGQVDDPQRGSLLWAGTEGDGLWWSADAGRSWQSAGPAHATVYDVVVTGDGELMIATDQGILGRK